MRSWWSLSDENLQTNQLQQCGYSTSKNFNTNSQAEDISILISEKLCDQKL